MASSFAYLVLFCWPLVVVYLFRRLEFREALCWSIMAGYLLVPQIVAFDLPLLPPFDKTLSINLSAAIMCVALAASARGRQKVAQAREGVSRPPPSGNLAALDDFIVRRGNALFWGLLAVLFGTSCLTVLTNGDPLVRGTRFIPGLRLYDVFSLNLALLVGIIPFFLARRFLASPEAHVVLLKVIVVACLGYSLLVLWEWRMSPQLNSQIYGFHPHVWGQNLRGDGYRPIVFLNHGLWLAVILAMSSIAAMVLWKENIKKSAAAKWLLASAYILAVLVLCKSLGALLIAMLLLPLVAFFGVGTQLMLSAIVAVTILTYPLLRGTGFVPTDAIYNAVASINAERAHSLQIRFDNEDDLLDHVSRKSLAGWGSWGRNRVYNNRGDDTTTIDGYWIIVVSIYGWLGYIAQFGLLGISTVLIAVNRKRLQLRPATAGLVVVMAAALIDLIPNATISPLVWLIAGSLMGYYQSAEMRAAETKRRPASPTQAGGRRDPAKPAEIPGGRAADRPARSRPVHQRRPREG